MKTEAEIRAKVADFEETICAAECNARFAGSAMAMRDALMWVLESFESPAAAERQEGAPRENESSTST